MKIFNWIVQLFFKKKKKPVMTVVPPTIIKEATPAVQVAAAPGIKCPECGNRIVVSILQLTSYQDVHCGFCGLELAIDKDKSSQSIAALTRLGNSLATAAQQQREALS